jgi:hypothetical protein
MTPTTLKKETAADYETQQPVRRMPDTMGRRKVLKRIVVISTPEPNT